MSTSSSEEFSESDADSGSEEVLQYASASSPARATLAQLRGRPLQRQVDSTQFRASNNADFTARLAALQRLRLAGSATPSTSTSTQSGSSSMAVSVQSRSTLPSSFGSSAYSIKSVPSLCGTSTTVKSGSSASTSRVDSVVQQKYRLEEGDGGILEVPEEERELECCFKFLNCEQVFSDLETWDTHNRSHFYRRLPSTARCPFARCVWSRQAEPGVDVWHSRLQHMQQEHDDEDFKAEGRPDRALVEHLRREGLITDWQYQELRRYGRTSDQGAPLLNTASRRNERRSRH